MSTTPWTTHCGLKIQIRALTRTLSKAPIARLSASYQLEIAPNPPFRPFYSSSFGVGNIAVHFGHRLLKPWMMLLILTINNKSVIIVYYKTPASRILYQLPLYFNQNSFCLYLIQHCWLIHPDIRLQCIYSVCHSFWSVMQLTYTAGASLATEMVRHAIGLHLWRQYYVLNIFVIYCNMNFPNNKIKA